MNKELTKEYEKFRVEVRTFLVKKDKNAAWLAKELDICESYVNEIINGNKKAVEQRGRIRKIMKGEK